MISNGERLKTGGTENRQWETTGCFSGGAARDDDGDVLGELIRERLGPGVFPAVSWRQSEMK
jgi:hypothetical protein